MDFYAIFNGVFYCNLVAIISAKNWGILMEIWRGNEVFDSFSKNFFWKINTLNSTNLRNIEKKIMHKL